MPTTPETQLPATGPAASEAEGPPAVEAFRPVPRTGVIFVDTEAGRRGYRRGDPDWANLGQGQPETGPLPGAPPRREAITIHPADHEYAPVPGVPELRQAVAELYNHLYRQGMKSRYTADNVAISGGGRASLTRAAASLAHLNLGHFLPDYTAYEELLDIFRLFSPIPILRRREARSAFSPADLEREILGRGLGAILLSNPCNPMGKLVSGAELAEWVGVARRLDCALLFDEFYSHYVWNPAEAEAEGPRGAALSGKIVSAARYVEDVDRDPVVIFDGLTKNWRYPGWRVTWTVGPRAVIEAVSSAGSFLDGGGSRPLQMAAVELLEPASVLAETEAIHRAFRPKRDLVVERVREMGMTVARPPDGTFYVFASLENLPAPLSDGMAFFRAALERRVITVPGAFFDVNPGGRRAGRHSRFHQHLRISFGPQRAEVERGLERLAAVVAEAG